jgi:hypothetical protein
MAQFPVLVAGHSQARDFDQFLKLPNINVVFFPGRKIEQMEVLQSEKKTIIINK